MGKFVQKWHPRSKTEKINIVEIYIFCIFKIFIFYKPTSHISPIKKYFWFFGPNLPKKGQFWSKIEKVNITIEFCTFKFLLKANFSINRQSCFFPTNMPKEVISGQKQKKANITMEFCIFSLSKVVLNFTLNKLFSVFGKRAELLRGISRLPVISVALPQNIY